MKRGSKPKTPGSVVDECRRLRLLGVTVIDIGVRLGISPGTVSWLARRDVYPDAKLPAVVGPRIGPRARALRADRGNRRPLIDREWARVIRVLFELGLAVTEIAELIGVTYCVVNNVIRNITFKDRSWHIPKTSIKNKCPDCRRVKRRLFRGQLVCGACDMYTPVDVGQL